MINAGAVRSEVERLTGQAANLFGHGLIDDASGAWQAILNLLGPQMLESDVEKGPEQESIDDSSPGSCHLRGTFMVQPLLSDSTLSSPSCLTLDDRIFSVYANAVHYFPGGEQRQHQRFAGVFEDRGTVAACMYNLGLCSHLRSLLSVSGEKTHLDAALRYYDAAQNVLVWAGAGACVAGGGVRGTLLSSNAIGDGAAIIPPGARALGLALLNNRGCIYDRRFELEASRAALRDLRSLVLPVISAMAREDCASADSVEVEAFSTFLMTAVMHHDRGGEDQAIYIHAPCA
jgi:hypothetical protein